MAVPAYTRDEKRSSSARGLRYRLAMLRRVSAAGLTLTLLCGCERASKPGVEPSGTPSTVTATPVASAPPATIDAAVAEAPTPAAAADMPKATELQKAASGSNAFGFDLYARTAKKPGNLVFAPASIS